MIQKVHFGNSKKGLVCLLILLFIINGCTGSKRLKSNDFGMSIPAEMEPNLEEREDGLILIKARDFECTVTVVSNLEPLQNTIERIQKLIDGEIYEEGISSDGGEEYNIVYTNILEEGGNRLIFISKIRAIMCNGESFMGRVTCLDANFNKNKDKIDKITESMHCR